MIATLSLPEFRAACPPPASTIHSARRSTSATAPANAPCCGSPRSSAANCTASSATPVCSSTPPRRWASATTATGSSSGWPMTWTACRCCAKRSPPARSAGPRRSRWRAWRRPRRRRPGWPRRHLVAGASWRSRCGERGRSWPGGSAVARRRRRPETPATITLRADGVRLARFEALLREGAQAAAAPRRWRTGFDVVLAGLEALVGALSSTRTVSVPVVQIVVQPVPRLRRRPCRDQPRREATCAGASGSHRCRRAHP